MASQSQLQLYFIYDNTWKTGITKWNADGIESIFTKCSDNEMDVYFLEIKSF